MEINNFIKINTRQANPTQHLIIFFPLIGRQLSGNQNNLELSIQYKAQ